MSASPRLARHALACVAALCLISAPASPASAATATRVHLNPNNADSSLFAFATVGAATYFAEGGSQSKLWRSDSGGLTDVTGSLADAFPRIASGSTLYLTASDADHGNELWKIESGTASLVADLTPGSGRTEFGEMAVGPGGDLYFVASVNGSTYTLYKTDGTEAGTNVVQYAGGPVINVQGLTRSGSQIFMKHYDYTHGEELWTTDGTVAGTQMVKDINPTLGGMSSAGSGSQPRSFTDVDGTVFFVADPGSGWQVWKSDGTEAGTTPIDTGTLTTEPTSLAAAGSVLYFNQTDGSESVLRRTDGGAAETVLDSEGAAVQAFDVGFAGTTTYLFRDTPTTGSELWKTGGIGSVATLVKDIAPGTAGSGFGGFTTIGSDVYFAADDRTHGAELWKSDGTSGGTTMVQDVAPGASSSNPMIIAKRGVTLLFVADDREHGRELWTTDGTSAGTAFTEDLQTGPVSDDIGVPAALGGSAYFAGNDGTVYPPDFGVDATALYRASGDGSPETVTTAGGGRVLAPRGLAAAGTRLFLAAYDRDNGYELWATDGTPAGTGLVKDIRPGSSSSNPFGIAPVGSRVYFAADDGVNGSELWVSDGTSSGTTMVADLQAGANDSSPGLLTPVGNRLFFMAWNDSGTAELWTSDGTTGGTTRVLQGGAPIESVDGLTAVGTRLVVAQGSKLLAVAAATPTTATEIATLASQPDTLVAVGTTGYFEQGTALWKTDGTAAGTVLVKDGVDANGGTPASLTAVHKTLYFTAADSNGDLQLWKSDGTDAGTARVAGPAGGGGANPYGLLAVRDRLYFVATDGGDERWMTTDGATTELLGGADPVEFNPFDDLGGVVAGDRLFLAYHSPGPDGSQLWRVSGLPPAPAPDPEDPGPGTGDPGTGGGDTNGGGSGGGGGGGGGGTPPTPPTTPTPPAPSPPAAALKLTIGKFALDRRRGTATFTLSYPAAATVKISGPGVTTSTVKLRGKRVTVKVRPNAKLMRTLRRKHKATVTLTISCQPASGKRVTVKKKVTLVRR